MNQKLKRIGTDAAGYGMVLLGIASGWLPGPGGIPLVLGGLGLLSINNEWAARLRDYIVKEGGQLLQRLFPDNKYVQAGYDLLTVLLLALVTWLAIRHAALWQISLAGALFFIALLIAGINRDRLNRLKAKVGKA